MSLIVVCVACLGVAQSSSRPAPIRLVIRKADPYFVKAMLENQPVMSAEMSTTMGAIGMPQAAGVVNGFFGRGKFMVNPIDNSLWFFPEPQ